MTMITDFTLGLTVIRALPGALLVSAGIGMLLAGALMMLGNVRFDFILRFNRNAVYHLVQLITLLLYLGLSLRDTLPL